MLIATIITYNDMPLIVDCMESIYDKVDKIIIVDGKFKDFPGIGYYSSGESLDYLLKLSHDDKFKIILVSGLTEVEKRNVYLQYLHDGDICLNIDTDEVLIGEIPELTADIGIIQIGEEGDRRRHRRTNRYFKYRTGLHYWGKHTLLLDKDDCTFAHLDKVGKGYTSQDTKIEFLHNNHKRDYNRIKDKKKYYQILMKREARINEPITN